VNNVIGRFYVVSILRGLVLFTIHAIKPYIEVAMPGKPEELPFLEASRQMYMALM